MNWTWYGVEILQLFAITTILDKTVIIFWGQLTTFLDEWKNEQTTFIFMRVFSGVQEVNAI